MLIVLLLLLCTFAPLKLFKIPDSWYVLLCCLYYSIYLFEMYVGRDTGSDGKCVLFCVCVFLNANKLTLHHCEHLFDGITTAWVPAHEGKWGQLTPWKNG